MYDLVLGKKEQWEHRIIQGLPERSKLSEPVGVWFTEFGPVNTGMIILILLILVFYPRNRRNVMVFDLFFVLFSAVMLWSYQSLDDRIRIRNEAQQMEEWTETGESYKVEQDAVGGYTKGIVVSSICEDFLLKKETWSHSRHCLVCKWLKFFCRILNVTGSPNRTGSNLSILSGK